MTARPQLPADILVFERGWLSSNNVLFLDGEKTVLVDSGYCIHAEQTLALVDHALRGRSLDFLVNTHLHSDHCGGNAALQHQYPNLKTSIPPGQAKFVNCWDSNALTYEPTGQQCPRFTFDHLLSSEQPVLLGASEWQVHAAPGHDPHSVIFFDPKRKILISADALWENGFGVVFPELEGRKAFAEVGATFDVIEQLQPDIVIPGHGATFFYHSTILESARNRLQAFVQDPARHARHAAKVLLKFKLLEVQQWSMVDHVDWALRTPYFKTLQTQFFPKLILKSWIERLCEELIGAGVAKRVDINIVNC